jgi:hypothetical protein
MTRRLRCWAGALAVGLAARICAAAPGEFLRDWKSSPAIAEVDARETVYVLGDVHGQFTHMAVTLWKAGIVGAAPDLADPCWIDSVTWTAGSSILVQTGDMIDKGPASLPVLRFLRRLQESAAERGGRVVVTMGNHEDDFLRDPLASGSQKTFVELEAVRPGFALEVAAGTDAGGLGAWLRSLPFGARVNDWFFCHAGNTRGETVAALEARLESEVLPPGALHMDFGAAELVDDYSALVERSPYEEPPVYTYGGSILATSLPNQDASPAQCWPFWWHPLYLQPPASCHIVPDAPEGSKAILERYARALGVAHLVQGHEWKTLVVDGNRVLRARARISQLYGLLFFVDVGMTDTYDPTAFDGAAPPKLDSILAIRNDDRRISASVVSEDPAAHPEETIYSELVGDLDGNGRLEAADLALLRKALGVRRGETGYDARADLNGDGAVDGDDVAAWDRLARGTMPVIASPAGFIPIRRP